VQIEYPESIRAALNLTPESLEEEARLAPAIQGPWVRTSFFRSGSRPGGHATETLGSAGHWIHTDLGKWWAVEHDPLARTSAIIGGSLEVILSNCIAENGYLGR